MVAGVPVENGVVRYIDGKLEDAQLGLNTVSAVPLSGFVTGPARAGVGVAQLVTTIGLSIIRAVDRRDQRGNDDWQFVVYDGLERVSRGVANVAAGAIETLRALNPLVLYHAIGRYMERRDRSTSYTTKNDFIELPPGLEGLNKAG